MKYYIWDKKTGEVREGSQGEWMQQMEDVESRRVKEITIGGSRVSTVFLGLDHSFTDKGPPILWETLVFGGKLDQEQQRYASYEEAVSGHEEMVRRVEDSA